MFEELSSAVDALVEGMTRPMPIITHTQRTKAGIDIRAVPYILWYGDDVVIINNHDRPNLEYYGGFEYVDAEFVKTVGNYTMYCGEDSRVRSLIDNLLAAE